VALQIRRGTSADVTSASFVPLIGEPLYLTDNQKLYIGDGSTQGGNAIGGATDLDQLTSVTLIDESVGALNLYTVTSNTVLVTLSVGQSAYYVGLQVVISNSSVAALNGTHTITSIPTGSQFAFALTTADVTSTSVTGVVTPKIPNGNVLSWNETNSYWENAQSLSDVVSDTTPQLGGNLDTNNKTITSVGTNNIEFDPATGQNVTFKGNATDGSGRIKLNCEANSHGIIIKGPPHSAAATYTLTLPNALPTVTGQSLTSDTSGNLSFTTVSGGGGAASRASANAATSSIADGASADITITGAKSYMLMSIQTSAAAWVTVYTSTAARTSDASRSSNTDPLPGSGVIAEVITGAATTQKITPGLLGFNDESTVTSDIYLKVENRSGSAAAITVTLSLLVLES
tara:strand:+ start:2151 stop:3356 length:1206 start_codon:yes stop_codon:yes gene_type:complete